MSATKITPLVWRAILLLFEVFSSPNAIFGKDNVDCQFEHIFYHAR